MERQRQTDRKTNKQIDKQSGDKRIVRRQDDKQKDRERRVGGGGGGRGDRWTDRQRQTDRQKEIHSSAVTCIHAN